jgi:hypothetical protein
MTEVYLQSLEYKYIIHILNEHHTVGYFRYVEDILIINNTLNEEHYILECNAV